MSDHVRRSIQCSDESGLQQGLSDAVSYADEDSTVRITSLTSYRIYRFFIHRTASRSMNARQARLRSPYLAVPAYRGECFTGTSFTVYPRIFTSVGMKRCMPL